MFTIALVTERWAPSQTVVLRWGPNWELDRGGVYRDGAWEFTLDEAAFPNGITFKFVLAPQSYETAGNRTLDAAACTGRIEIAEADVAFDPPIEAVVERGVVPQKFFVRNLDPHAHYDVIVVGSGMGGGLLASRLAAAGANVLVLEAGSYLFPTHVGNLPRRLKIGRFDKHVWSLWQDFQVRRYENLPGSVYAGGQGFNLGGRSLFWGGLIPRQSAWELGAWPDSVRDYLLTTGYDAAEAALNRIAPPATPYQDASRSALAGMLPGFTALDASLAVAYGGATHWSIPTGLFSTADLLMEDRLTDDPGRVIPTVNLSFAVWRVEPDPADAARITGVVGWDLLGQVQRRFSADTVVLAAGTIESAKIALQSGLTDPTGLIGRGITDHTIRYRHFTLPPASPFASTTDSAKVLLRHDQATTEQHAFDVVVELGADFNQGRYVDPANLARERAARAGWMLCELVFMSYAPLLDDNQITVTGDPATPVKLQVARSPLSAAASSEQDALAAQLFAQLGAASVLGEDGLALQDADVGGVAHEVGTLRMTITGQGVVDDTLKFLAYDNLYACDNSVFPASPAANPSLTLAALALRLTDHLRTR